MRKDCWGKKTVNPHAHLPETPVTQDADEEGGKQRSPTPRAEPAPGPPPRREGSDERAPRSLEPRVRKEAWRGSCKRTRPGGAPTAFAQAAKHPGTASTKFALPAGRRLRAENRTLGVTCWRATPSSTCACVCRAAQAM
ncbi:hypothetical protein HPG69_012256 [Diceros bicornis minor]|uniref:Uncharacterized protein n=1 Tax=Diceros bicornis minor TaxID=77932 RepID=A0A7J7F5D5_DICBM|nr:hypothetical protein HPG69_012256 [Diceros bicornis minor]